MLAAQSQLPRPAQLPPAGGQAGPAPRPAQPAPGGQAQTQAPPAGGGGQAQAAPPKPYKPVAVTPAKATNDASFEGFRKRLGEIAGRKDRAALAAIVAPAFFRIGDQGDDKAEKGKSGIDNLVAAIDLDASDGAGWDTLVAASQDATLQPFEGRQGVMCSPAPPAFDENAFEQLIKSTGTDDFEWGYPSRAQVEVRGSKDPSAAVVERLGLIFVRILADTDGDAAAPGGAAPPVRVVTPSGKTGYVPADALVPLSFDQLCFVKQGNDWKITGYIGGE
jgi:hypothetical protein